ncbi:phosphoribosyltransferase family protein [Halomarina salina]|uniref:Phosphoribosyltransferase family protein n=1 Tax=Halomarina salina TaxID=1872699 RepID=A0ABD5RMA2_9EURY|nr:phosphoribosyltransferase family protein [Halomarina salina]
MNRAEKATLQLRAVAVLRTLKRTRTYDELAEETGLPAGDLNRYVNGHVLPGEARARGIVTETGYEALAAELESRIRHDDEGYVDNSDAVFDQPFLDLVAPVVAERFEFETPDVVLTAATDGITLGSAMARHFDARLAYAKKSKETAVEEFVEARKRFESGIELTYYLPEHALAARDSVLVVDDLIRSGETQELLLDIATQTEADVVGVFALIAAGTDGVEVAQSRTDAPVGALTTLD